MPTDDLLTERLLRVVDEGRRTATYKLAPVLRSTDRNLAPGTPLWLRGREFVDAVGPIDLAL